MDILFIGNSFTQRNDLPGKLRLLAWALRRPVEVRSQMVTAGGASLRRHWNSGEAEAAIKQQSWDWVVLQEQSTLPMKNHERFHENVRLFLPAIAAAGARLAFYSTWARRETRQHQSALDGAYAAIAHETSGQLVPVGPAWQWVRAGHPEIELYDRDGSHPSVTGTALAAATFCASLFQSDPTDALTELAEAWGVEAAAAPVLGAAAWKAVTGVDSDTT